MTSFNPLKHPVCFTFPSRVAPSTWTGHVPFGMFLVDLLKPKIIVELGSYYGVSYSAFCQAVKELGLDARCYAIDTWEGDPQSGFYGPEVLADLKNFHDPQFGGFSRLIQSTFGEAVGHFADGSISLLHIDGFHTYEEVKRDYEIWLPKLSESGVILFHDINVRERDFGVWRFWEELKLQHPHFEFIHSHGLGVLAIGRHAPTPLQPILQASEAEAAQIREFFFQLGMRLEAAQEAQTLRQAVREQVRIIEVLQHQEEQFRGKDLALQQTEEQLRQMQQQLQEREQKSRQLEETVRQAQEKQQELYQVSERRLRDAEQQLKRREAELLSKAQLLEEAERQLQQQERQLQKQSHQLYAKDWMIQEKAQQLRAASRLNGRSSRTAKPEGENLSSVRDSSALPVDRGERDGALLDRLAGEDFTETRNNCERLTGLLRKLVVAVVTYHNSSEQIEQLLKSIQLASDNLCDMPVEVEIFVTDNGAETEWPKTHLRLAKFDSEGNVGFGKAMNRMMSVAFANPDTEWFLCLNPDGALHHKALRELLLSSGQNPASLIEARQFPEEHLKQYDPETHETPWASGACLLIRRNIYQAIGGFDQHLFMYLEDVDLSWRARAAGFSVKVSPNSLYGHDVLGRGTNPNADRALLLSGRYMAHKWGNTEFLRWAEQELIGRGYFASPTDLPVLPELDFDLPQINPDLTDFAHYFHFSPARW